MIGQPVIVAAAADAAISVAAGVVDASTRRVAMDRRPDAWIRHRRRPTIPIAGGEFGSFPDKHRTAAVAPALPSGAAGTRARAVAGKSDSATTPRIVVEVVPAKAVAGRLCSQSGRPKRPSSWKSRAR